MGYNDKYSLEEIRKKHKRDIKKGVSPEQKIRNKQLIRMTKRHQKMNLLYAKKRHGKDVVNDPTVECSITIHTHF